MTSFTDLPLIGPLLKNLNSLGYKVPTAIQAEAIPFLLEGHDLLGIAQTGTGKTAAFCLPLIQRLLKSSGGNGIKALVLVPTRELASQIHSSLEGYGKDLGLKTLAIFGGVGQSEQVKSIRDGVDILVATPGRLLDLESQNIIRLGKIETLVLDEADRMLDMGFIDDLQLIIEKLPKERQTVFFSATIPREVMDLSRRLLKDPKRVEVSVNSSTVENIEQKVIFCKREDKFQILRKILKEERELVVVFTKTKNSADKVKEYLMSHRIASSIFHGDKSQEERERALQNFKDGSIKILIATDIASRGIDIQGISHVVNFELPLEAENYVHRIGRTGRAGKKGTAITLCDKSEEHIVNRIQNLIRMEIPSEAFNGPSEGAGRWLEKGPVNNKKAPTPGKSQEKTAYLDHSKRQKIVERPVGAPKAKNNHPGLRAKNKKR